MHTEVFVKNQTSGIYLSGPMEIHIAREVKKQHVDPTSRFYIADEIVVVLLTIENDDVVGEEVVG